MTFPTTFGAQVDLAPSTSPSADVVLCTALVASFQAQGAQLERRDPSGFTVRVPLGHSLIATWTPLVGLDRVEFTVTREAMGTRRLAYRASILRVVVIATAMLSIAAVTIWREFADSAWLLPLGWLWLVGGNYVMIAWRLRRFVRREIALHDYVLVAAT